MGATSGSGVGGAIGLDVLGLRRLAHEQIVDQPLRAMRLPRSGKRLAIDLARIEALVGAFEADAEFVRPPSAPGR